MKNLTLIHAAVLIVATTSPVLAADMTVKAAPFTERFAWTGCYLGGSVGGGWARKDLIDPVQLAQDTIGGPGTTPTVTTTSLDPSGVVVGGQIGCDYQFAPSWVVGIEGAGAGSTLKGSTTVALPQGNPGDAALVDAKTDFLASLSGRLGYAIDRVLLYAKGGFAWAGDKYNVTGTFTQTPFNFEGSDTRTGWTAGGGVEWAFARHWSTSLEYDYYDFGHRNVLMTEQLSGATGVLDTHQRVHVVKLGLNFHVWASDR